ncbi:MAG: hypothetical protein KDC38_16525 [Planctomycetes bacterium]|nr:hypothetical protein [Planctomycetota bacterium]
MARQLTWIPLIILFVATAACCGPKAQERTDPSAATPDPRSGEPLKTFIGRVTQTMDAPPYTYVEVTDGSMTIWAAAPSFEVAVGDQVIVPEGQPMVDFPSRTLNRKFDLIYFCAGIERSGSVGPVKPEVAATTSQPASMPDIDRTKIPEGHPTVPVKPDDIDLAGIERAKGGYTVSEVVEGRSTLAGRAVAVRGKVVKFNANIMGRNWLHIRDGSGIAGVADLTVTTSTPVNLGDTVLIEGTVVVDKDFGAGYRYDVLLEEAKVTVE